jgi:hypothetical protein
MRNGGKKPVSTVDLRTHRLNVSSEDPQPYLLSVEDIESIARKVEEGAFSDRYMGSSPIRPDLEGKPPKEAEQLAKVYFKATLDRWASGVGAKADAAQGMRDFIEARLKLLRSAVPGMTRHKKSVTENLPVQQRKLLSLRPGTEEYKNQEKVVKVTTDELRHVTDMLSRVDKEITYLERHYPGNIYGRSEKDTNAAKNNFYSKLDLIYKEVSKYFVGKSIAKSGTGKIIEHTQSSPPTEVGKIDYNHARALVQFYVKAIKMKDKAEYSILPDEYGGLIAVYNDPEYQEAVNNVLSYIYDVVYDDDPLVSHEKVYGVINLGQIEKIAREFNIPLKAQRDAKNKIYAEKFYSAVPTKVDAILQAYFSDAVSKCIQYTRSNTRLRDLISSGSLESDPKFIEAKASVQKFVDIFFIFGDGSLYHKEGKEVNIVNLTTTVRNAMVNYALDEINALAKSTDKYMKAIASGVQEDKALASSFPLGFSMRYVSKKNLDSGIYVVDRNLMIDAVYYAARNIKIKYVFSAASIRPLIKFVKDQYDNGLGLSDIFASTAVKPEPEDYVAKVKMLIPELIKSAATGLESNIVKIIASNNMLNNLEFQYSQFDKFLKLLYRNQKNYESLANLSDWPEYGIYHKFVPYKDGDNLMTRLETIARKIVEGESDAGKYTAEIADILKSTQRTYNGISTQIEKVNDRIKSYFAAIEKRVIEIGVNEDSGLRREAIGLDVSYNAEYVDQLVDFALTIKLDDIPTSEPEFISGNSHPEVTRLNAMNESFVGVPDIFFLLVNAASVGAVKMAPLVRGKKRRLKPVFTQGQILKGEQIAAYSRLARGKKEIKKFKEYGESIINVDSGRSPWYYIYTPVMSSVTGRAIPGVSLLGPFRSAEAFKIQSRLLQTAPPRQSFKATLTTKEDVYSALELLESIAGGDSEELISSVKKEVQSLSKQGGALDDNNNRIMSYDSKVKSLAREATKNIRKSMTPPGEPLVVELISAYARKLAAIAMGPDMAKNIEQIINAGGIEYKYLNQYEQIVDRLSDEQINPHKRNSWESRWVNIIDEDAVESLLLLQGIRKIGNIDNPDILFSKVEEAFIESGLSDYMKYVYGIDYEDPAYENITGILAGDFIDMSIDVLKDYLLNFESRAKQYKLTVKGDNKDTTVTLRDMVKTYVSRVDRLFADKDNLIDAEKRTKDRILNMMSSMIGTRCVVIDMRKFIAAVGTEFTGIDYEELSNAIWANEKATIGAVGLNPMGIIAGIEQYMSNFMVLNYGRSEYYEAKADEGELEDTDRDDVTIGLTLTQAAQLFNEFRDLKYSAGMFYVAMVRNMEELEYSTVFVSDESGNVVESVIPKDRQKEVDTIRAEIAKLKKRQAEAKLEAKTKLEAGEEVDMDAVQDNHKELAKEIGKLRARWSLITKKTVKFDAVRFWRNYINAAKSYVAGEGNIDPDEDFDAMDYLDDFDTIMGAGRFIPVIKGIYPVASKNFIPINDQDTLSEFDIEFLTNSMFNDFMGAASTKAEDEYDFYRENPSSRRYYAVESKVYILWFLEAYDAMSKSKMSNADRMYLAHKATLQEMLKEGYCNPSGELTDLGMRACAELVVTPWAASRFKSMKLSVDIPHKIKSLQLAADRDNPKGYPLTGEKTKVVEGGRRQFLKSAKADDLLPSNEEVVMYRPKIVTDEGKYYRPRIYLTVPKDITLSESNTTRNAIRKKALKSVTYDATSRRYVHTPKGPMNDSDIISFYLDSKLKSRMKEVAPKKRLEKGAGPRGKSIQEEIMIDSLIPTSMANVILDPTNPASVILETLQAEYMAVRKNQDNKTDLPNKAIAAIVKRVLDKAYEHYIITDVSFDPENAVRSIITGCSDAITKLNTLNRKIPEDIKSVLNSLPNKVIEVGEDKSSLKEFILGKVVESPKARLQSNFTNKLIDIVKAVRGDAEAMMTFIRESRDIK